MMGFGYSAKPVGYDYSLMDQADLAQALCGHLGVDRVSVWEEIENKDLRARPGMRAKLTLEVPREP